ncbi:MAG: C13 family peptidase [Pseudomonadota bacterium]
MKQLIRAAIAALALTLTLPAQAGAGLPEFDLLWPSLPRPYYFQTNFAQGPRAIGRDDQSFIYVADRVAEQVKKYSPDGVLVNTISDFTGLPNGVAVDSRGRVIVTTTAQMVYQYNADGEQIRQWGGEGTGPGQFSRRCSDCGNFINGAFHVAIDDADNYYVLDPPAHRVQKFDSEGQFLLAFGSFGTGPGQFGDAGALGVAHLNGRIYVSDQTGQRLNVFATDGNFIEEIDGLGEGINSITTPLGLAPDGQGNLLVVDGVFVVKIDAAGNQLLRFGGADASDGPVNDGELTSPFQAVAGNEGIISVIDRFGVTRWTPDGLYRSRWGAAGSQPGQFAAPETMAADSQGNSFVADTFNQRIQRFDEDGFYLGEFQPRISEESVVSFTQGIAVASDGTLVVTAQLPENAAQRFTQSGQFLSGWASQAFNGEATGSNGVFARITNVFIDSDDLVYMVDEVDNVIQVFDLDGTYLRTIGAGPGDGDGQFLSVADVAEAPDGTLLVGDNFQFRVQRFSKDGTYLSQFPTSHGGTRIAVTANGRVYLGGRLGNAGIITAYELDGTPLGTVASNGVLPGQVGFVTGLDVDATGRIYALERTNSRMQRFRPPAASGNTKAIVVTGGGPYPGNALWDATQLNANFAYRTLVSQGFQKDTIQYLSADVDLDLDQNGQADDVDADATNAAVEDALTGSFADDADNLLLYLVDHGGVDTFRMSGSEVLTASSLNIWIDAWQTSHPDGRVTVIYDACESGSFMDNLAGPNRLVITSSSPGEVAYFVSGGTMSFSNVFWTQVFNGENVEEAFVTARDNTVSAFPSQNALIDADGDGTANEADDLQLARAQLIGRGASNALDRPVLGDVSAPAVLASGSEASISVANVFDNNGIGRVWAVVRPPGFQPGSSDNPVAELPLIELSPAPTVGTYEATSQGFNESGTYRLTVYAQDRDGNVGVPRLASISVNNPTRRRGVIAVGTRVDGSRRRAYERNGNLAFAALEQQGYGADGSVCRSASCDDVRFLSSTTAPGTDGATTLAALQDAITEWGTDGVGDLTVYLVGEQNAGEFVLNATETVSAATLNGWLDQVDAANSGQLTVVYDGDSAGLFLPTLASNPVNPRIILTSAGDGDQALFRRRGRIAYSRFFWTRVLNGATVRSAHRLARAALRFASRGITPQIEDQGNGVPNEFLDGQRARFYRVGSGVLLAGDEPVIGGVTVAANLSLDREPILAAGVTTTSAISEVFAAVTQPSGQVVVEPLAAAGADYQTGSVGLCAGAGDYEVSVFAADRDGNLSQPAESVVNRAAPCADTSPDLTVDRIEAPAVVLIADATAEMTVFATNVAVGSVASAELTAYVSDDAVIDASDTPLGTRTLFNLFSYAESPQDFEISLPSNETTRFVGACVEVISGEADVANNCSSGAPIRVAETALIFNDGFEP